MTYERFKTEIVGLKKSRATVERHVHWLDESHSLGVARNETGHLELFFPGPELVCESSFLRDQLHHDAWERDSEPPLEASRLLLPAEPHLDAFAAFVCAHLLESGYLLDRQAAMSRAEPIIELVFDHAHQHDESSVGLFGELLVLQAVLAMRPERGRDVVDAWQGHSQTARDFYFGSVGLEIKTTRGRTSTHHVHGVAQVERGHLPTGSFEDGYYLMSLSLEVPAEGESGPRVWALPDLVEDICTRLGTSDGATSAGGTPEEFLAKVSRYGGPLRRAYDHAALASRALHSRPWRLGFARCYDMDDELLSLPSAADFDGFKHMVPGSAQFMITLPPQLRGDLNPRTGLRESLEDVLARSWAR